MSYVSVAEVKATINFPTTGSPVSDADIQRFILDAQDEIERFYHTKFGNVEVSGTADSAAASSLTDTGAFLMFGASFDYTGYVIQILTGTGAGQYRGIVSNTDDTVIIQADWDTIPDNTSTYQVVALGYKDQDLDGNNLRHYFVPYQPLIELNALNINGTQVDLTSGVYTYNNRAMILLDNNSDASIFTANTPQNINFKYIYGVAPIPRVIKRLCALMAGMMTVAAKVNGSYTDFSTISLPGQVSGSKGQPYVNLQAGISELQKEAKKITETIYRRFTLFG